MRSNVEIRGVGEIGIIQARPFFGFLPSDIWVQAAGRHGGHLWGAQQAVSAGPGLMSWMSSTGPLQGSQGGLWGLAMTARHAAVRLWATESPTRQCGGEPKDTCCREDGTAWTANVSATDGSDREPSATQPPFRWCQKTGGLRFKTREVHASVTAVQAVR